ncbi:MAG TPA: ankyrin repeat domain-containing protein, partial [Kofleriaceae bacterium]|nr:ankyrin repeat domain-containing protein [Kofleriaceae bacterium]
QREVIDAARIAWPLYYELKCLHAAEQWEALLELMASAGPLMAGGGPVNHSYTCSLAMEASFRVGDAEGVAAWGHDACAIRLGRDPASFDMSFDGARALLGALRRPDVELGFLERMRDLALERDQNRLAVHCQSAALDVAERSGDEALAARARVGFVEHLARWRELVGQAQTGAIHLWARVEDEALRPLLPADLVDAIERGGPVFRAAHAGRRKKVLALLDAAGDSGDDLADHFGRTALGAAAFAGHASLVAALLARGRAAIDRANLQRRTPLHQAADQGHTRIVRLLLEAGAARDPVDLNGQTPLILASWQNHGGAVRALLAAGADPERRDHNGHTALHLTATEDAADALTALVTGGAEVDVRSDDGHTPLMMAAMEGRRAHVVLLLAAGADPSATDASGMTARDWARQEGFEEIAAIL